MIKSFMRDRLPKKWTSRTSVDRPLGMQDQSEDGYWFGAAVIRACFGELFSKAEISGALDEMRRLLRNNGRWPNEN